jgi:peptide chain release factor 2
MALPGFWSVQEAARPLVAELKSLLSVTEPFERLRSAVQDDSDLVAIADERADLGLLDEAAVRLGAHRAGLRQIETKALFRGGDDARDAILLVHAGAGGVDAMDWAERLERMYWRWLTRNGFEAEIADRLEGEEAGIHRSMIEVRGPFAYGHLRGEAGVHRVCHISEFDAQGKKQTSFASVDVVAVHPEARIDLREVDMEMETFSAGGPGGQHVNKTQSAVRIRHLPTGIAVKCQSQRSQIQNRRTALELLAAKLLHLEEDRRRPKGAKTDVSFGHQIRTYVLEPYQLVKDHRTGHEVRDARAVLDGDVGGFIDAFLRRGR